MRKQADNNVVFNAQGNVSVTGCRNCPFLTPDMGEHCVLRPEINLNDLYQQPKDFLPSACPLRPGGLEVILDFNRDEELAAGRRFAEFPTHGLTTIVVPGPRYPPNVCEKGPKGKTIECLYDEDAETGNGQSDFCVRCHAPR